VSAPALRRVDLTDPVFAYDETDPEGFRAGRVRMGPSLGARETGASLYELPPGQAICPYHYEYGEEEWLLVVSGDVTVRHPGGTEVLGPMQATCFVRGPEGAHQVRNDSGATVRLIMWSTVVHPTATAYPDSGKVGIYTGVEGEDVMVRRTDSVPYYDGETAPGAGPAA
jgi:uncharacterized cupin superfamily protein